jgi:hypothetical protein
MQNSTDIDFDARYTVDGYSGVAFWLKGWAADERIVEDWDDEPQLSDSLVIAVMVGDDREHIIDVDDLTPLDDDAYCPGCGQGRLQPLPMTLREAEANQTKQGGTMFKPGQRVEIMDYRMEEPQGEGEFLRDCTADVCNLLSGAWAMVRIGEASCADLVPINRLRAL